MTCADTTAPTPFVTSTGLADATFAKRLPHSDMRPTTAMTRRAVRLCADEHPSRYRDFTATPEQGGRLRRVQRLGARDARDAGLTGNPRARRPLHAGRRARCGVRNRGLCRSRRPRLTGPAPACPRRDHARRRDGRFPARPARRSPSGAIAGRRGLPLRFGGGTSSFLVSVRPRPVFAITTQQLPRPGGLAARRRVLPRLRAGLGRPSDGRGHGVLDRALRACGARAVAGCGRRLRRAPDAAAPVRAAGTSAYEHRPQAAWDPGRVEGVGNRARAREDHPPRPRDRAQPDADLQDDTLHAARCN